MPMCLCQIMSTCIEQRNIRHFPALCRVQQSYTMYHNREYGKTGHLFQGRYKAIICDRDSYMPELIRYIHLNPCPSRDGKTTFEYEWSSHSAYTTRASHQDWLEVERPLSTIDQNKRKRFQITKPFIADGIETGHRKELYQLKEQRYLGDAVYRRGEEPFGESRGKGFACGDQYERGSSER